MIDGNVPAVNDSSFFYGMGDGQTKPRSIFAAVIGKKWADGCSYGVQKQGQEKSVATNWVLTSKKKTYPEQEIEQMEFRNEKGETPGAY